MTATVPMRTKSQSPMLTIDEVAEILKVDARTVRRYCTNGDLEYVKFGPNTLRFKPDWIDDFIARKQRGE